MSFLYSAVIRSVGLNNLLDKTLWSLQRQTLTPAEILIVIPEDTNVWEIKVPNARFVKAERGMVSQRAAGIRSANHDMLLLDDDVDLEPSAAELLMRPIFDGRAECIVPYWGAYVKTTVVGRFIDRVFGLRIPKDTGGGLAFTLGGGFHVPAAPAASGGLTEAGPGIAIALSRSFAQRTSVVGEIELQALNPFAFLEDAALVFQIGAAGGRALMIPDVGLMHLEGTTRKHKHRVRWTFESTIYNHFIFWKKYIYVKQVGILRLACSLSVIWALVGIVFWAMVSCVRTLSIEPIIGTCLGFKALLFRRSKG